MASIINTNIPSLNAQRNLSRSQGDLDLAIQRLSSGLRINSAKDDAAGLAIASRQTVQINGLAQASRNANDGISISQTAEGAMDEITRALTRANDLAVQAASYNTSGDRESLNNEVQELISEIGRIVTQTRYNGEAILDGGFDANIQVGVAVNETISISVGDLSTSNLGVATTYTAITALALGADTAAGSAGTVGRRIADAFDQAVTGSETISGSQGTASVSVTAGMTAKQKADAINDVSGQTGVEALVYGNGAISNANPTASTAFTTGEFSINGVNITGGTYTVDQLLAQINSQSADTGVTASTSAAGDLVLANSTGEAISVSTSGAGATASGFTAGTQTVAAGENGILVLSDDLGTSAASYDAAVTGTLFTGVSGASTSLTAARVDQQSVSTAADANLALLAFGNAINQVNGDRSELGAKLNRLEGTIRNLDNVRENITAARSRIQDADFAEETARLARAQVLTQAGTAMVAQANAQPQNVLALLQ